MPTRVNGIGTGYIGASNKQSFDGVCEHCHRRGMLQNYETRLWFTVFFIPVIPLAKKQILSYCPSCTWHRAVPFGEWERIRHEAVGESATKWDENRDDPDAAMEMHGTLVAFQKRAEADRLASILLERFGNVSKVQFYVGGFYERSGKGAEADACFARSLELDPTSLPAKRAVAIGHIEQGRLDQARKLMADFEPPSQTFEPAMFYMLARAHQRSGQHQEALDLFRMLIGAAPGFASDKEFRKAVRRSEQALGIEASLVRSDPFYRSAAFKWTVAIAAALLAIFGWNLYVQTHRTVEVVNGLSVPITVQIDGTRDVQVAAQSRTNLPVAEGKHKAVVTQPAGFEQPVDFAVEAGWFHRFFSKPVWVLDPTRSAAVVWESVVYTDRNMPGGGGGGQVRWHLGEAFTTYPDVDFRFEPFPEEVTLKDKHEATKTRVDLAEVDPAMLLSFLMTSPSNLSYDALPYLESHIRLDPDNRVLLAMYYQTALQRQNIDRCRTYLASRLADRPVLVEIHRIYQRLGEMDGKVADLVAEYDRYLEREPENSMLLYLRGRIDPVPEKGGEFLKRAQAADPDNAYPWFAQGYRQRANGEFAEARKALEKASKLKSDDQQMRSGFTDVRFALREFDPLASELEGELETAPLNLSAHNDLMEVLTAAGKDDKAGEVHKKLEEKSKELGLEPQLQFGLHSQLHLSYLRGKLDEMRAALPSIRDPNLKAATEFQTRLESGELENLAVGNAGRGDQPAFFELLLSLACSRKGNAELAAAARQRAITALAAAGTEQRQAAELLKQGRSLDVKAAESILLEPDDKAILLTALAETCPEKKEPLLALAEKLNYRLGFPHRFLKQTIAAMRGE